MSTTIDQRVVEMRFDNRQFESNVSTTMSTLDKLKQKLNLTGAAKGFEDMGRAANKVDMSGLGRGVEQVGLKFNAMYTIADQALRNITNRVQHTAENMAKALTIDPIKTGFQEYETQINAVQTILANTSSKGTTLQQVNAALDELNTYADKTIYNFTEMTRNIGTFTAAGVDLDKSVSSIKGIANLAAVSGSSSQQASTAMYQLSQALAAGRVSLMDWNSVVNAGMGGQVFQDALKRTAKTMGIVVDESKSFRESISGSDTWLSSDVLVKTLEQFTMAAKEGSEEWNKFKKTLMDDGYTEAQAVEILKMANTATEAATKVKTFTQLWDTLKESAQSGWTQSWEIIVGDFEEAKKFLTKISDTIGEMIGASAEARNSLLSEGLSTGWKQLLGEGIVDEAGYQDSIKAITKEHGVAFDELVKKTEEAGGTFNDALVASLKDGSITSDMMTESVTHLANSMRNMTDEEREAAGYTKEHLTQIEALEKSLKDGSVSMDEFVNKMMRPSGRENLIESLWNSFNALMSVVKPIKEAFREVFNPLTGEQLYSFTENLKEFTSKLTLSKENAEKLKATFKGLFSVVDIGWTFVKELTGGIVELLGRFTGLGGNILDNTASLGEWLSRLRDTVKETGIFGTAVDNIVNFLGMCISKIKEFGSSVKDYLGPSGFDGFIGFFKSIWTVISSVGSAVAKTFGSVGKTIAEALGKGDIFEVINTGLITGIVVNMTRFSNAFGSAGSVIGNIKGILEDARECFQAYQDQLKAGTLMKIAAAIGILAAALFVISTIEPGALAASLGAITVLFTELIGSLAVFGKMDTKLKGVTKSVTMMIGMSIALVILAGALKKLSTIDPGGLAKGLVAVGVLMAEIAGFLYLAKFGGKMKSNALGIVLLSSALLILTKVVDNFSKMNVDAINQGLFAIGALLLEIAAFSALTKNSKHVVSTGLSMILLAAAMKIMASVVKDFGGMDWSEIGKGLTAMAGALAEVVVAMRLMPNNSISVGLGLVVVGGALKILANVMKDFGGMSWGEIGKGLGAIGIALVEFAIALNLMKTSTAGSVALLIAAGALAVIAPVLKSIGEMSVMSIVKSLAALAATFAIIGIAASVLAPALPAIIGLAAAMSLIGVSVALVGGGLLAISAGFAALAAAGAVGATAFVAALTVIVIGIIDLIPSIARAIGEGVVEICKVIGDYAPQIAESALKLLAGVMESLATYTPQIVESLLLFLIGVIDGLANHMPTLIQSVTNLIGSIFEGVVAALNGADMGNLLKGSIAVAIMSALVYALSGVISLVPSAMAGLVGVGLLMVELVGILAIIGGIAQIPGLSWLVEEGGNFLEKIGTAIGQFVGGLVGGVAKGFTSSLPEIGSDLSSFMSNVQTFIDGIKSVDASVLDGAVTLAGAILAITAADFVNGIASFVTGGSSLTDFAEQLVPFGEAMMEYSNTVSGMNAGAVVASAIAAQALSALANGLPNSGGLASIFAGENDLSTFAEQLVPFGEAMMEYSKTVSGIDAESVTASANAAKSLSELANNIPNSGGLASLFVGENSLLTFGAQLPFFGRAMKAYADSVAGIDAEAVIASANAAKSLSELATNIPNSGGLAALFVGENSLSSFGGQIVIFGRAMKSYAESVAGVDPEAVTASANAAKSLSELASNLPNSGGLAAMFTGENDLSSFGGQIIIFGRAMKAYADSVAGVEPEAVIASANAAKALSELATNLPNSGGLVTMFTGDNSLLSFGAQLPYFGKAMKAYADSVAGIDPESVTASANAAKALSELATNLPNSGGLVAMFTGENGLDTFGDQLEPFGKGIKKYADAVAGIDAASVTASANAAKSLSELATNLPNSGGLAALFAGDNGLDTFGDQLEPFGKGIKKYADAVSGLKADSVSASVSAAKKLINLVNSTASINTYGVGAFVDAINLLGTAQVDKFVSAFDGIPAKMNTIGVDIVGSLSKSVQNNSNSMANAAKSIVTSLSNGISASKSSLTVAITSLLTGAQNIVAAQNSIFANKGVDLVNNFIKGVTSRRSAVTTATITLIASSVSGMRGYYSSFHSAGGYLVDGFAAGISANSYKAAAKARAMAKAAKEAAEEALGIASPSKVFYKIGNFTGLGFVKALGKYADKSYDATYEMATYAKDGLTNALSGIQRLVDGELDAQPTIRPVLDLSSVRTGAAAIGGMFGNGVSIGTMANVNTIGHLMNGRIQNGNDDVVSAINKLGASLAMAGGDTYNLGDVSYDDGSAVSDAVKSLVKAARVERRR